LHGALRRVFDRRKEPLKFQAAAPLMHQFQDADAQAYLLAQTKSQDTGRAYQAITMLAAEEQTARPPTKAILDHLTPHLQSTNTEFRRAAVRSLATYSGEEVVQRLIPLLGDLTPIIIEEAKLGLREQQDQKLVRRLLTEAAANHADPKVRSRAKELLERREDE
jgi:HEAT repeat protein